MKNILAICLLLSPHLANKLDCSQEVSLTVYDGEIIANNGIYALDKKGEGSIGAVYTAYVDTKYLDVDDMKNITLYKDKSYDHLVKIAIKVFYHASQKIKVQTKPPLNITKKNLGNIINKMDKNASNNTAMKQY